MNSEQHQKLLALVSSSTILSPAERSEWLALLDLMNDKQLGELEKILNSKQHSVNSIQQTAIPSIAAKPLNLSSVPGQMPKLSHIMNLPNLGNMPSHVVNPPHPQVQVSAPKEISQGALAKKSGFAQKLKSIFAEKELPAGKPEMELAAPSKSPVPKIPQVPQVLPKPLPSIAQKPTDPMPVQKPAVVAKRPVPENFGLTNRPSIIGGHAPVGNAAPPKKDFVMPAPVVQKPVEDKEGLLIQEKIRQELAAPLNQIQQPKPVDLNLEALADLAALDNKAFQRSEFTLLVSKVRQLVKKYGYFDVVFNLEKSPLYKNYIQTGLELLTKGSGFEQLAGSPGNFLTRQQFEKLADLLRQIQVA